MLKVGDKLKFKNTLPAHEEVWKGKEVKVISHDSYYHLYELADIKDEDTRVNVLENDIDKYLEYIPKHAKEMVNHPSHYNKGIETIDYIESWGMNFNAGNVVKYVTRSPYKGNELEDLKKARFYLDREIARVEKENEN